MVKRMSLAAPASRAKTLAPEAALAARILRAPHVPSEYVKWLAAPQLADSNPPTHRGLAPPAAVTASIAEILQPLVADAGPQQQAEAQRSAVWLGAISHFSVAQSRSLGLGMGMRKLSACLLPLYRTLATGKLREGLQQTRCRLLELLALLALCQEMGDDLVNLLESSQSSNADPDGRLKELFAVDLVDLAELLRLQLLDTDEAGDAPSPGAGQAQWLFNPPAARTALADWCEPQLLWRLAGELLSRNSEFVLPRAWADTPVPWSRIADHWNALAHLLTAAPAERERPASNWLSISARATESYSDEPAAEGAAPPAAAAKRRQRKDGPRIDTVEQNGEEQDRAAREGSATAADPVLKANQHPDQQDTYQHSPTRAGGHELDSAPAAP
ncbi:MAG: hypothetical protein KDA45_13480, partial [Planctomycetales bacterium]|nr:hypothetical protein [Planctomycetales bacterium]